MVNYKHGKIYKIVFNNTDKFYIGSTTNTLSRRKSGHLGKYKSYDPKKTKHRTSIFDLFDEFGTNCDIILIEEYPCDNSEQLRARERYHIDKSRELTINKINPLRTEDDSKEYHRKYYIDNKELILDKNKKYREENREYLNLQKKEYISKNKEYFRFKMKEYYDINKNEINNKRKEKITCICGKTYSKGHIRRHERSNKHQKFMNEELLIVLSYPVT